MAPASGDRPEGGRAPRSGLSPAVLGGAGLGCVLVVVVAVASDGGDLGQGPSLVVGQGLFGLLVGGLAAMMALGIWLWLLRLGHGQPVARRTHQAAPAPWWLRSLVIVAVLSVALVVASWVIDHANRGDREKQPDEVVTTNPSPAQDAGNRDGTLADEAVPGAFLGGVLLAVGATAVLLAQTRNRLLASGAEDGDDDALDDDDGPAQATNDALAASAADLEREADPRRAVVLAYMRMQVVVGAAGTRRRATETELEFLARILTRLGGDAEPARVLTDLFARARYSDHAVDEPMRAEALAAVRRLQSRLAVER